MDGSGNIVHSSQKPLIILHDKSLAPSVSSRLEEADLKVPSHILGNTETDCYISKEKNRKETLQKSRIAKAAVGSVGGIGCIYAGVKGTQIGEVAGKAFGTSYIAKKMITSGWLAKIRVAIASFDTVKACKKFGKISGGIIGAGAVLLTTIGIINAISNKDKPQKQKVQSNDDNTTLKTATGILGGVGGVKMCTGGVKYGGIAGKAFGASYVSKKILKGGWFTKIRVALSSYDVVGACTKFGKVSGGIAGACAALFATIGLINFLDGKPKNENRSNIEYIANLNKTCR